MPAHAIAQLRFISLRKVFVQKRITNPKSKPRHERLDVALFTKTVDSKYVDFQDAAWHCSEQVVGC